MNEKAAVCRLVSKYNINDNKVNCVSRMIYKVSIEMREHIVGQRM